MDIEYLHLYVRNAVSWRNWFLEKLGFQPVAPSLIQGWGEMAIQHGHILILLSSQQSGNADVQNFLKRHSEGIADIAFRVPHLDEIVAQIQNRGGTLTHPIQTHTGPASPVRWCRIRGWGSLCHTLIESRSPIASQPSMPLASPSASSPIQPPRHLLPWLKVDHAVLNVPSGQLEAAATWYETSLGFTRQQHFAIATAQSGLRSLVLKHPSGSATLPINEPTSANSQIQEFLDLHQGSGIQHVALQTANLVKTVKLLRQRGVPFLSVPPPYYQQLSERPGFWHEAGDWDAIAQQQILVDWSADDPRIRLLQTFTQPLFEKPTFFWELIERQAKPTRSGPKQVEGFGEGNFQALFEAIEREQQQRGTL